ncbi:hypothetical protein Tco_1315694 [Tanacetum coccineum]
MDDPNITMEEYIQLMADKAQGRDQTFNWETTTYGKVYYEDLYSFTDFPTIVYNDASTSNQNVSSEPTVSIYNAIKPDIDFHISFSDSEDEDYTFIYNKDSSSYKLIPSNDLKLEPVNDYVEINIESCLENIDVKPMDSVICISKDTTLVEFDENFETNHDVHRPYERNNNIGGVFINLEISKCWSLEISRRLFNTLFAQELILENYHEQNIREFSCAGDVVEFRTWPGISLETAMISTMDLDGGT